MVAIRNKDSSVTTDRDKIVDRCAEFYKSARVHSIPTSIEEAVQEVLSTEAMQLSKCRITKEPGADGVVIDIIKEGRDQLNKHIAILFTSCLSTRKIQLEQRNNNTTS